MSGGELDKALWESVAGRPALLEAAAKADPASPADLARLRKQADADAVRVALQLVAARRKAVAKFGPTLFGEGAEALVADPDGVEQATSWRAARPKAQRFADAGCAMPTDRAPVVDLCCGIGLDAKALVAAGCDVVAYDVDAARAWMAARNAGCAVVQADVTALPPESVAGRLIHLDPARRVRDAGHTASRRTLALNDLVPSPTQMRPLIQAAAGAAVKLSPGVDASAVRDVFGDGELCFTSEPTGTGRRRKLTQATWYGGSLRREASRCAVLTFDETTDGQDAQTRNHPDAAATFEVSGKPVPSTDLPVAGRAQYLVVPDPAVERAEVLHLFGLPTLHPGLGVLTADQTAFDSGDESDASSHTAIPTRSEQARLRSHGAAWFEVAADMPWRERTVKRWLADHDAGVVEVKTRGRAVEPDALQRRLRGDGRALFTVFVLRLGPKQHAYITRPAGG